MSLCSNHLRLYTALLLCVSLVAGCRTYGQHGNLEETKEQMQIAVETFADELVLATTNLERLEQRASEQEGIRPFVNQYARLVTIHSLLLEGQQEEVVDVLDSGDYRSVHRLYGAVIAEQQAMAKRYRDLLEGPRATVDTTLTLAGHRVPQGRYAFFPPFYQRMQNRLDVEAPNLEDSTYLLQRSAVIDSLGIPGEVPGAGTHMTVQEAVGHEGDEAHH